MNRFNVIFLFAVVLLIVGWSASSNSSTETFARDLEYTDDTFTFKGGEVRIALAETDRERLIGLSRQRTIGENEGLLFIFDESAEHGIWMRDMNFSIDIIWLDDDLRIVDIKEQAAPGSFRSVRDAEIFTSRAPARYVLEVRSGFVATHELVIGDTFSSVKGS